MEEKGAAANGERQRTGTTLRRPTGLEDQVAAEADVVAEPSR